MPLDGSTGAVSQALLGPKTGVSAPSPTTPTPKTQQPVSATAPYMVPEVKYTPRAAASKIAPPAPPPNTGNPPPDDVFAQLNSGIQQNIAQLNATSQELDMVAGNVPPVPYLPPAPKTQAYNPIKAWGSPAMILALVASAFTRRPMVAALNSASKVITAMKQNDAAGQQQAFKEWQANTANALQNFKYEMDQHNSVLTATEDNSKEQIAMLNAQFGAFGKNGGAYAAWQQGGAAGLRQFFVKTAKTASNLAAQSGKLVVAQIEDANWQNWLAQNPKPTDPAQVPAWQQQALVASKGIFSGSAAAFGGGDNLPTLPTTSAGAPIPGMAPSAQSPAASGTKPLPVSSASSKPISGTTGGATPEASQLNLPLIKKTDPTLYNLGLMMANYDVSPPSSYAETGGKPAQALAIAQAIAASRGQVYDATLFEQKQRARVAFAEGKEGNAVRSFNVMVYHLNTLQHLANALNNGNIQTFNRIANQFSVETGQPQVTDFNAAKQAVADEVQKAIIGGATGVGDRAQAAANINAASSPAQLSHIIQTYQQLAAGQLIGYHQQYLGAVGVDDFNQRYLLPQTLQVLQATPPADMPEAPTPYTPTGNAATGGNTGGWNIQEVP
jgi:hypothetical protein